MKLTCIPTSAVLEPITTFCASFSRDLSLQPPLRCTPISLSLTLFSVLVRSLRRRSFRPSSSPTAPPCFFFDRDRCPCFRTRVLHPSGPFLLRSPCFLRTPALVSLPPRHPPSSLQDLFVLLPRQSLGHPSRLLSLLFPFSNFVPTFLSIFPPVPCIPYDRSFASLLSGWRRFEWLLSRALPQPGRSCRFFSASQLEFLILLILALFWRLSCLLRACLRGCVCVDASECFSLSICIQSYLRPTVTNFPSLLSTFLRPFNPFVPDVSSPFSFYFMLYSRSTLLFESCLFCCLFFLFSFVVPASKVPIYTSSEHSINKKFLTLASCLPSISRGGWGKLIHFSVSHFCNFYMN